MAKTARIIFVNLVDFDMLYGHRNDCEGFYRSLLEFDEALPRILSAMKPSDLLSSLPTTEMTRQHLLPTTAEKRFSHLFLVLMPSQSAQEIHLPTSAQPAPNTLTCPRQNLAKAF
jgi:phosphopentomutase